MRTRPHRPLLCLSEIFLEAGHCFDRQASRRRTSSRRYSHHRRGRLLRLSRDAWHYVWRWPAGLCRGLEFLKTLEDEKLLENIRARGEELREGLTKLAAKFDFIREIRIEGLMIGVELSIEGGPFVSGAMQRGLLINCTHDFTLRLLPPFIITRAQVREFLRLFELVLATTPQQASAPDSAKAADSNRVAHATAR